MKAPYFIGIGAPRCGTSWLHIVLSAHPKLWLPPIKELHYFDAIDPSVPRTSYRKTHMLNRLKHNLFGPAKPLFRIVRPGSEKKIKIDPDFDRRYFFGNTDDSWYAALFKSKQKSGLLTGEITPSYCLLSEKYIQKALNINPETKFIYMIRDPVKRSWSHAIKDLCRDKNRPLSDIKEEELSTFLFSQDVWKLCDYIKTIDTYLSCIDPAQFFIGIFDDLAHEPEKFLGELCRFLSIEPNKTWISYLKQSGRLSKPVNSAAKGYKISQSHERRLAKHHFQKIVQLNDKLEGRVHPWLVRYESLLRDTLSAPWNHNRCI